MEAITVNVAVPDAPLILLGLSVVCRPKVFEVDRLIVPVKPNNRPTAMVDVPIVFTAVTSEVGEADIEKLG